MEPGRKRRSAGWGGADSRMRAYTCDVFFEGVPSRVRGCPESAGAQHWRRTESRGATETSDPTASVPAETRHVAIVKDNLFLVRKFVAESPAHSAQHLIPGSAGAIYLTRVAVALRATKCRILPATCCFCRWWFSPDGSSCSGIFRGFCPERINDQKFR